MEIIAHRYGNSVEKLALVEGRADLIEVDVHPNRGRVQVRHAKRLWLTSRHWERWHMIEAGTTYPDFAELLDGARASTRFWIDCKGPNPALAKAIRTTVPEDRPLTVSSKAWWVLHRFADRPATRIIRSVGNRFELLLLRRLPSKVHLDGVVVHERLLDSGTLTTLSQRFGAVYTWAVPDRARAEELRAGGIAGVILDDLDLILELSA